MQRVLVAGLKHNLISSVSVLVPKLAGAVGRRVERNFDGDAAGCAIHAGALKRRQLRRAGEGGAARAKVQHAGSQPVSLELRVVFHQAAHAARLAAKDKARKRDVVAANVHQATATDVRHVADVERVRIVIGEE